MTALLRGLFGGGSSFIYIVTFGALAGLYWDYGRVKQDNVKKDTRIEKLEALAEKSQGAMVSQLLQRKEEEEARNTQKGTEDAINSTEDSSHCVKSDSINVLFGRLQDNWGSRNPSSGGSE